MKLTTNHGMVLCCLRIEISHFGLTQNSANVRAYEEYGCILSAFQQTICVCMKRKEASGSSNYEATTCGPSLSIFLPKAENPNTGDLKLLLLQSSFPFTSNITLNNSVKPSSSSTITTNSSSMKLQIYLLDFTPLFSIYIHRLKTIEVWVLSTRLFRFSEAQNVKKGSELICVAMVLIDSKATELSVLDIA
ncbi:hypothetical protein YC2023_058517 [Brassica napus]